MSTAHQTETHTPCFNWVIEATGCQATALTYGVVAPERDASSAPAPEHWPERLRQPGCAEGHPALSAREPGGVGGEAPDAGGHPIGGCGGAVRGRLPARGCTCDGRERRISTRRAGPGARAAACRAGRSEDTAPLRATCHRGCPPCHTVSQALVPDADTRSTRGSPKADWC